MKKPAHANILKSLRYAFAQTWSHDRRIVFYSLLPIPFKVADRLADVYLIALIVDAVASGAEQRLLLTALVLALCKLLAGLIMRYADWQISTRNYRSRMKFISKYAQRYMQADFTFIESTEGKDLAQRAKNAMTSIDYRDKPPVERVCVQCAELFGNLCGLFVYGGIISLLNPLILLLLGASSGISYLLQRGLVRYDQKDKVRYIPLERRLWYLIKEMRGLSSAKDIRLYGMSGWLGDLFRGTLAERMKLHTRRSRLQYAILTAVNLINTAFTGSIYYYLIRQYLSAEIDISQFLLYFGLITGFGAWLMGMIDGVEALHSTLLSLTDVRWFQSAGQDLMYGFQRGLTPLAEARGQSSRGLDLRLEQVSFGYGEKLVLEGIDLAIRPGEKIAIVGLNGAGKTTLVKLICGLYTPRKGRILLDGQDLCRMDPEERIRRLAVVFQDIYLLPASIERNITLTDRADPQRLEQALALSGLKAKTDALPQGTQTLLVKSVLDQAIDLSGGEVQKLALARALYKGGDLFILDEPTAKLDPIAENEMYQKYSALTQGKTSIFISHRLSSTRFCDRILYLEDGSIKESGTHEELLRLGGAYARLFEVQSRYYRREEDAL